MSLSEQILEENDFYCDVIDKASEYDYCMVLKSNDDNKGVDENGDSYLKTIQKIGLEIFPFHSHDKTSIYVLIRAPLVKFRAFCDHLDFSLLLNHEVIEDLAKHGSDSIAPFQISHNPEESRLNPYEKIYGPYKIGMFFLGFYIT